MSHWTACALALAALSAPAAAQTWKADFNLPNGTQMGTEWTETSGDMVILNNAGRGNVPGSSSKLVHVDAKGSYAEAKARVTLRPPSGTSGPHVALVLGDGGSRNLYTKFQDNNSDGTYDRVFFYSKDNGTGYGPAYFQDVPAFSAGRVEMYVSSDGDTLNVDLDANFDGTFETHVANSGILGFSSGLGDGFAIGAGEMGAFDDWEVEVSPTIGLLGSPGQLSLSAGGVQALVLGAPVSLAGQPYLILGSLSGTQPGISVDGLNLPLEIDAYWLLTLTSPNQPPLAGSFGTLDAQAQATASFTVPSGSNSAWAGVVFDHACAVFDLVTLKVSFTSNPVSVALIP